MKKMVDFLNHLLSIDRETITRLFNKRVITHSEQLINHSKVQIAESVKTTFDRDGKPIDEKLFYQLGMLGLLNGAYYNGKYIIAAIFDPKYREGRVIKQFNTISLEELEEHEQTDSD
tara:strand:- start:438 stop:788 length:351 start_codon:yes stop_codon:yes gene_type:complete